MIGSLGSARLALACGFLLAAVLIGAVRGETAQRPNFVVILCDDLGYGDLASYGHPHIRTPHLDELASQGMRLTSCYAAAPVCSPSRAGLMTGRTPSRVGVYDWICPINPIHLRDGEVTVAERLQQAGYDTAMAGKWHLNGKFNSDAHPQPGDQGFDHWLATQNNARPSHQNPANFVRNGEPVGKMEGFSCRLVAEEAVRWLGERESKEDPFFLYVAFHEPHEPVESPDEIVKTYEDAAKNRNEAEYFANVTNMDKAVGELMAALEEKGLAENTLVWFTSDNGPETLSRYGKAANRSYGTPGPLRGMKLWLYEGGIRVPGILRWPGRIAAGSVSAEPVSGVDVLPTLCELAGVEPPDRTLDGTSIVPLLDGRPVERETPLFWHYYRAIGGPKAAMRIDDWMVLGRWDGPPRGNTPSVNRDLRAVEVLRSASLTDFELYHLRADRTQQHDLSAAMPDKTASLGKRLRGKHQRVIQDSPAWSDASIDR